MTNPPLRVSRNRVAALLVAGGFLVAVAFAVKYSLDPIMYFSRNPREEGLIEYPWVHISLTLGLMLVYSLVLLAAVAKVRFGAAWFRSGIGLFALLVWSFYISRFFLHMPGYWMVHLLYLWVVVAAVGGAFLVASAHKVWSIIPMAKRGHA